MRILILLKIRENSVSFRDKIYIFEDIDCCIDIVKKRENVNIKNVSNEDYRFRLRLRLRLRKNLIIRKSKIENESIKIYIPELVNPDKLTLGHILNLIDGIKETPGRIIIITSNFINKIDPALRREGRIDHHLNLDYITYNCLEKMYEHYYNKKLESTFTLKEILLQLKLQIYL